MPKALPVSVGNRLIPIAADTLQKQCRKHKLLTRDYPDGMVSVLRRDSGAIRSLMGVNLANHAPTCGFSSLRTAPMSLTLPGESEWPFSRNPGAMVEQGSQIFRAIRALLEDEGIASLRRPSDTLCVVDRKPLGVTRLRYDHLRTVLDVMGLQVRKKRASNGSKRGRRVYTS